MAQRKFVSLRGMADSKREEAAVNRYRKQQGLTHHPVRGMICGCVFRDCGALYSIERSIDMRDIKLTKRPKQVAEVERECHHVA